MLSMVTRVTGSLETLHMLPQVSAAARTLVGAAVLVGSIPVLTALTWKSKENHACAAKCELT